jgi:hypothetical protein
MRFYLSDPAKRLLKLDEETFKANFVSLQINGEEQGVVMVLNPLLSFTKKTEQQTNGFSSWRFIRQYVNLYKKYYM